VRTPPLTGPSQTRLKPTEPGLRPASLDILKLLGTQGGAASLGQRLGLPGGALQQQGLAAFANLLAQPTPEFRNNMSLQDLSKMLSGTPGGNVVAAGLPVFQRNLSDALAAQREVGPRFASAGQRESRLLEQQGLQDFNLFTQQALTQGRQQQLAEILGAFQGAASAQAPQLALLQQLLPTLFQGGLSGGMAVGPSALGQIAQLGGAIGGALIGIPGLGGGGGGGATYRQGGGAGGARGGG
jgi:hypothetical protein